MSACRHVGIRISQDYAFFQFLTGCVHVHSSLKRDACPPYSDVYTRASHVDDLVETIITLGL